MRIVMLLLGAVALGFGAAAAALAPNGSMPDISRTYYERDNCHQAYDLLVETLKNGGSSSGEERAWGKTYEDNAAAGTPCPKAPAALLKRAANRTVVTDEGLAALAKYHKQKDPAAYFEAAYTVLTGKTNIVGPEVGWQLLKVATDLGDPSAEFFLGSLYIAGTITGKADYAAGFPLVQKAAVAGHIDALFMLANMYKEGLGTKKDARQAFAYYQQAAERGHVYAAYLGAYMANDGDGVKVDRDLAYRLARNLADQGEVVGAVIAASTLLQRKDARDHEDEVLYWMDVAIRDGDQSIRSKIAEFRPKVVAAFKRANAPPEYHPRVRKACPTKTVCLVDRFTGAQQQCTTNKDYWSDCDF